MITSTARVPTDAAARYAKQLVAHLGRKVPVVELADGASRLTLSSGTGTVRPLDTALVLVAEAEDEDALRSVEDVLSRHLVRFGARRELTVGWTASPPGTTGSPAPDSKHSH